MKEGTPKQGNWNCGTRYVLVCIRKGMKPGCLQDFCAQTRVVLSFGNWGVKLPGLLTSAGKGLVTFMWAKYFFALNELTDSNTHFMRPKIPGFLKPFSFNSPLWCSYASNSSSLFFTEYWQDSCPHAVSTHDASDDCKKLFVFEMEVLGTRDYHQNCQVELSCFWTCSLRFWGLA